MIVRFLVCIWTKNYFKKWHAYRIIDIKDDNSRLYDEYTQKAMPIVKKYGGRYLVRGGKVIFVSGNWNPKRVVMIKFPSHKAIEQCFSSQEYKDIASLRFNSTTSKAIIVVKTTSIWSVYSKLKPLLTAWLSLIRNHLRAISIRKALRTYSI